MNKNYHDILDSVAGLHIPDDLDLFDRVQAKLDQRRTFVQTMRARPALAILVAILALLMLTGVAYAISRSLGYIPGVGLVDKDSSLRILAEPVSQTRNGITVTVEEAVLSSDMTVIRYAVENLPLSHFSQGHVEGCKVAPAELKLPAGSTKQGIEILSATYWDTGYEIGFSYEPLPADINETTLLIPCIFNAPSGMLPEHWEFSLRFVPAPSDFKVLPVIEYTPSPVPQAQSQQTEPNRLSISKVIETNDSYILVGEFRHVASVENAHWSPANFILTDRNGQDISWDYAQDIDLAFFDGQSNEVWALKVPKTFTPPLHIVASAQYTFLDSSGSKYEFEFDAGLDPQAGQTWKLNKEIQMSGQTFILEEIMIPPLMPGQTKVQSYIFSFVSPDGKVQSVSVDIEGYESLAGGGGGGGDNQIQESSFSVGKMYADLPKGKLKIILSNLFLLGKTQEAVLDWQP